MIIKRKSHIAKDMRRMWTLLSVSFPVLSIRCSPDLEFLNLGSCGSMSEIDTVAIELSVYCK